MSTQRKRLSDILMNSEREKLAKAWGETTPAAELTPLPAGEYRCKIVDGLFFNAKSGTLGYKLTLEVIDGEHVGRRAWLDIWLSEAALPLAKRDLSKLGIETVEQLERPLPDGIVVAAKIALRRGDSGEEFNKVSRFEVVGIEPPKLDPFAPGAARHVEPEPSDDSADADGFDWGRGEQRSPSRNGVPTP